MATGDNDTGSGPDFPPEILGHCFQYLPFLDRFRTACVCQYWRSCALSFPALWADINLSDPKQRSQLVLFEVALSRVAQCVIDFECNHTYVTEDGIAQLLSKHTHQLRSVIQRGGLGFLVADVYSDDMGARSFGGFFSTFPCLVSLSLLHLPSDDRRLRDLGRAPPTLSHISLQTSSAHCNLGRYLLDLEAVKCKDVYLSMPKQACSQLAFLITDARRLVIQPQKSEWVAVGLAPIVITLPGRTLRLTFHFAETAFIRPVSDLLVGGLLAGSAGMAQLRVLTMPLYTVYQFFRKRPSLPSLTEVCIIIQEAHRRNATGVLDVTLLYSLAFLGTYALSSCTLDARTRRLDMPTTGDAKLLLAHVAQYGQQGVRYILRGFRPELAAAVPIPADGGLMIQFELP